MVSIILWFSSTYLGSHIGKRRSVETCKEFSVVADSASTVASSVGVVIGAAVSEIPVVCNKLIHRIKQWNGCVGPSVLFGDDVSIGMLAAVSSVVAALGMGCWLVKWISRQDDALTDDNNGPFSDESAMAHGNDDVDTE
jgi:hypothetical protein